MASSNSTPTPDLWLLIEGINPEPWTAPEISSGRKNGKIISIAYKSAGLTAYQEAIQEDLRSSYPDLTPVEGSIDLEIYLWRQLFAYDANRGRARKHESDATNMQKALEDALQGIVITNDRNVQRVTTEIVEQAHETEPRILIHVSAFVPKDTARIKADELSILKSSQRHPSQPLFRPEVDDLF